MPDPSAMTAADIDAAGGDPTSRKIALLHAFLARANSALLSNPIDGAVLTSGGGAVTIAQSATAPAGLTRVVNPRAGIAAGTTPMAAYGGTLVDGTFGSLVRIRRGSTGFTTSRFESLVDGAAVAFNLDAGTAPGTFRVLVDNRYIGANGTPTNFLPADGGYVTLTFPNRAVRKVAIEREYQAGVQGILTEPTAQVWRPSDRPLTFFMVGDSYTGGTGSVFRGGGWAYVLGHLLGLNMIDDGVGGSGYTRTGFATFGSAARIALATETAYDVIGVAGGVNDSITGTGADTPAGLTAAALSYYQALRAGQPRALIVVFGAWAGGTGPSTDRKDAETAIKAAFDAWADPFSIFIPINTDPYPWVYGQGRVASPTGTGNADLLLGGLDGTDATHPNDSGHIEIGRRGARALVGVVERLLAGIR